MEKFQNNRLVLEAHLEELTQIVSQSEFIPKLKSTLPPFINWDVMDDEQKKITSSLFKRYINTDRTLYNSLFISAVASFESFLSQTIESSIQLLNDNCKDFNNYENVFLNRQIDFSGKLLSSIYSPPNHMNIDFHKICRNIGTLYPESKTLTLNPEISGFFRNILELESFSKFYIDLKIKVDIEEIARQQGVQLKFGSKGLRDTMKQLDIFLKETVKLRNRIAHTGQSASDISKDKIYDLINNIKVIADAINFILQAGLTALFKTVQIKNSP